LSPQPSSPSLSSPQPSSLQPPNLPPPDLPRLPNLPPLSLPQLNLPPLSLVLLPPASASLLSGWLRHCFLLAPDANAPLLMLSLLSFAPLRRRFSRWSRLRRGRKRFQCVVRLLL
jgi:hypothetical protein